MTTRTRASTRLRVLSLVAVLMLVVSACTIVGDVSYGCECPNLEATAGSIDWIGDGTVPDEVRAGFNLEPFRPKLTIFFNTPDRIELQIAVEDRLREVGFAVVETTPFGADIEGDEWSVGVTTSGGEENPRIAIFVRIVDDDARAAEILAPLVDALGTLP